MFFCFQSVLRKCKHVSHTLYTLDSCFSCSGSGSLRARAYPCHRGLMYINKHPHLHKIQSYFRIQYFLAFSHNWKCYLQKSILHGAVIMSYDNCYISHCNMIPPVSMLMSCPFLKFKSLLYLVCSND